MKMRKPFKNMQDGKEVLFRQFRRRRCLFSTTIWKRTGESQILIDVVLIPDKMLDLDDCRVE